MAARDAIVGAYSGTIPALRVTDRVRIVWADGFDAVDTVARTRELALKATGYAAHGSSARRRHDTAGRSLHVTSGRGSDTVPLERARATDAQVIARGQSYVRKAAAGWNEPAELETSVPRVNANERVPVQSAGAVRASSRHRRPRMSPVLRAASNGELDRFQLWEVAARG